MNGAVSKTVVGRLVYRGFESHPLRFHRADSLGSMTGFEAQIRLADPGSDGEDPGGLVVAHHLTDCAEIQAEALSGGHLLQTLRAGTTVDPGSIQVRAEAPERDVE